VRSGFDSALVGALLVPNQADQQILPHPGAGLFKRAARAVNLRPFTFCNPFEEQGIAHKNRRLRSLKAFALSVKRSALSEECPRSSHPPHLENARRGQGAKKNDSHQAENRDPRPPT
jgi:hypothetical protein